MEFVYSCFKFQRDHGLLKPPLDNLLADFKMFFYIKGILQTVITRVMKHFFQVFSSALKQKYTF